MPRKHTFQRKRQGNQTSTELSRCRPLLMPAAIALVAVLVCTGLQLPQSSSAYEVMLAVGGPRVWQEPNFLSDAEVDMLQRSVSAPNASECWSAYHQHAGQRTAWIGRGACNGLAYPELMKQIDLRVAARLNFPLSHMEPGYYQEYSGYKMQNVHLDQGHWDLAPPRVASAIIYLDTQPHGSGDTVFPLAHGMSPLPNKQRGAIITKWNALLNQPGRNVGRGFFRSGHSEPVIFAAAQRSCAEGLGVRPVKGTAVFFTGRRELPKDGPLGGPETVEALHGSCDVPHGSRKRVLVKLARSDTLGL